MADLVVELYDVVIGVLRGGSRDFDFVPDMTAVERFGLDSPLLSLAIPLTAVQVRARKARRQNFFREILPEGRMLTRLAHQAGLAENDVIGLLRIYGRDVAGAVQIWDPDEPGEPKQPRLEPLTRGGVADLLSHVQANPLGNKPAGGKTSLAGVQDKIVLARVEDTWNRVIDGWPSTHILKPESPTNPSAIYDEEYGARIIRAAGLASFATWIDTFEGVPSIVIERYDRRPDLPQGRLHQEDFNQVLGASGDQKYQRFGGRVSLRRIAHELVAIGDRDGLKRLFALLVVSVAIGNLDLHAKNVSLLHHLDGSMTLAPAYDVVPQVHHANDGELALAVNNKYPHAAIDLDDLVEEGRSWGLQDGTALAHEALTTVAETVRAETPHNKAYPELADDIARFAKNLRVGRAAGER